MKSATDFYVQKHDTDRNYSGGAYHMKSLWSARPFADWAMQRRAAELRLLDVGCGKGVFMRDLVHGLRQRWGIKTARVAGLDLVRSPDDVFAEMTPALEFLQADTDGNPLPFPDRSFDLVSCQHVLEHVFQTEMLVREFKRVLVPDGICIIGVPNIAAWINRIAFLWGNQPLGSEIGTEQVTYGFRPSFLMKKFQSYRPSGHIRDFTPRGLQDLTEYCGFRAVGR